MPGNGFNYSTVEATRQVEWESYADAKRNVKLIHLPKFSANFSDIVSDLLKKEKSKTLLKMKVFCDRNQTHSPECEYPNFSNVLIEGRDSTTSSAQDKKLVSTSQRLTMY